MQLTGGGGAGKTTIDSQIVGRDLVDMVRSITEFSRVTKRGGDLKRKRKSKLTRADICKSRAEPGEVRW